MLGSAAAPLNTKLHAKGKSKDLWYWIYSKVSVINCTFHGSDGQALNYDGEDVLIHNNMFSYNDWTGHSTQARGAFVLLFLLYEVFVRSNMCLSS